MLFQILTDSSSRRVIEQQSVISRKLWPAVEERRNLIAECRFALGHREGAQLNLVACKGGKALGKAVFRPPRMEREPASAVRAPFSVGPPGGQRLPPIYLEGTRSAECPASTAGGEHTFRLVGTQNSQLIAGAGTGCCIAGKSKVSFVTTGTVLILVCFDQHTQRF